MTTCRIVTGIGEHRAAWEELYRGYAAFYGVDQTEAMRERVFGWISEGRIICLLALDGEGRPIGLAHVRAFLRPLSATEGGYLDDLFVDPAARGSGAAAALLDAAAALGRERGWTVIRWITREDNYRARGLYDRKAARTPWVTYDIAL